MVFLHTDSGEYRDLSKSIPGTITFGRGDSNDIRPESNSVSKRHAVLTVLNVQSTPKIEAFLEDLGSRNVSHDAEISFLVTYSFITCLTLFREHMQVLRSKITKSSFLVQERKSTSEILSDLDMHKGFSDFLKSFLAMLNCLYHQVI